MELEEILARHRKELRDLTATVTLLKKQATKKTRKNVMVKCAELEMQLKAKHTQEIKDYDSSASGTSSEAKALEEGVTDSNFNGSNNTKNKIPHGNNEVNNGSFSEELSVNEAANSDTEEVSPESLLAALELEKVSRMPEAKQPINGNQVSTAGGGKKKRNRAKERLAKRQQEIDRIQQEAREEMENLPDFRELEEKGMSANIALNNLILYEIQPDGNCLFSSIRDQLIRRHSRSDDDSSILVKSLRSTAASYIKDNRETFAPFMYNEETDVIEDIDEYCEKLENTVMWGSDKEIIAYANVFDAPITVLSYDQLTNTVNRMTMNEEGSQPGLFLAYYRHSYGLGEHYNSLR